MPRLGDALDTWRVRGAAFFVAERIGLTRMQAVHRGANVALRFEPEDGTFRLRAYADGNDNGVRSTDITSGYDAPIMPPERLDHLFPGTRFGFIDGARLIDGTPVTAGDDPILVWQRADAGVCAGRYGDLGHRLRPGARSGAIGVVVLGATGRTRVVRFDPVTRQWTIP